MDKRQDGFFFCFVLIMICMHADEMRMHECFFFCILICIENAMQVQLGSKDNMSIAKSTYLDRFHYDGQFYAFYPQTTLMVGFEVLDTVFRVMDINRINILQQASCFMTGVTKGLFQTGSSCQAHKERSLESNTMQPPRHKLVLRVVPRVMDPS